MTTNKPSPVAEPASEPPHRLDSWATECSEPATDKDHLPVAPASAADGLPEPVAWADGTECNARGFIDVMAWSEGEFTVPLYTADQLRTAIAAERERARIELQSAQAAEFGAQSAAGHLGALVDELRAELRQQLAEAVRDGWSDADADAARLALELECLLTDKDVPMPALSRWWDSAHEALELHRARFRTAIAAQGEAKPPGVERELFEGE